MKESDRIAALAEEFAKLGVAMEIFDDGFQITGQPDRRFTGPSAALSAHGDHRIAMTLAVLQRLTGGLPWGILGVACAEVSYPGFPEALQAGVLSHG